MCGRETILGPQHHPLNRSKAQGIMIQRRSPKGKHRVRLPPQKARAPDPGGFDSVLLDATESLGLFHTRSRLWSKGTDIYP